MSTDLPRLVAIPTSPPGRRLGGPVAGHGAVRPAAALAAGPLPPDALVVAAAVAVVVGRAAEGAELGVVVAAVGVVGARLALVDAAGGGVRWVGR